MSVNTEWGGGKAGGEKLIRCKKKKKAIIEKIGKLFGKII